MALMVISSPVVMSVNPALIAAASPSTDPTRMMAAPSSINKDGSGFTNQAVVFVTSTSGVIKLIVRSLAKNFRHEIGVEFSGLLKRPN
jgi:hypothetical protein